MTSRNILSTFAVLVALTTVRAGAHPSVSVVVSPAGEVFYSDLERVWRIGPDGRKSMAIPGVHTHEMVMDSAGTLYGEESRWLGGDRYQHRIWKRTTTGRLSDEVPWRESFWRDDGLVRDASGSAYWVTCTRERVCTIHKRGRDGRKANVIREGRLNGQVQWIAPTPAGELFVIDGPDLRRVDRSGKLSTFARVSGRRDGRHQLMGVTLDRAGNVYVAAHADRAVVRVSPSGQKSVIARSTAPWAPTGVTVSRTGDLYILEWSGTATRVRRISRSGQTTIY